jgi:hypothetical protein
MLEEEKKLTEIVWCNHLKVTPRPLVHSLVPHVYLHGQKAYLAVEEFKIKLVCPECWLLSMRSAPLPFLARES